MVFLGGIFVLEQLQMVQRWQEVKGERGEGGNNSVTVYGMHVDHEDARKHQPYV